MTPDEIQLDALQAATRLLEQRAKLMESVQMDFSAFWGLDPRDLGIGDTPGWEIPGGYGAGLTYMNRKKRGEGIPAFLNEQQLRLYRQRIRQLVVNTPLALNVISAHQSYGVGEGFRYEAVARKKPSGGEPDPATEALVESAQVVIDAFCEHNEMAMREAEVISRVLIDGEAILRLFPRETGILSVRAVEPEHVYSPTGDSNDASFGVLSAPGDVEHALGYYVVCGQPDEGAQPELVPADQIVHVKHPETPANWKRGFSPFYAVFGELTAANDLLVSTVAMAKSRAKIAWVEKSDGMTVDVAQALASARAAATTTDPVSGQTITMERYRPGSILRTSSDIEFPAGSLSAADYVAVMQMVLRIIAARFSMPEYMLSSDASNANYSSTLVAESPFVKAMQRWQDYLGRALGRNRFAGPRRSLIWRQLAHAVEVGLLPREVFRAVDVQVTGPTLTVRDVQKEAQVDQVYHGLGVKSLTTIQLEQGLDPDEQAANFAKEREEQAAQQQANPTELPRIPGMTGQEQVSPDVNQAGGAFTESFSGTRTDSLGRKRCYQDGKLVPCPDAGAAGGKPRAEPPAATATPAPEGDPAAGRPSKPEERHKTEDGKAPTPKPLPWKDPPPKLGKKGEGMRERPKGDQSQTKIGDLGERLATALGFRSILPSGLRAHLAGENAEKGSTIDLEYDHSGRAYEVKLCNTTSTEYRLKAKAKEKAEKEKFAELHGLTPHVMVAVRDVDSGEVHFYAAKEPGFIGAEVSPAKYDYVGSVKP